MIKPWQCELTTLWPSIFSSFLRISYYHLSLLIGHYHSRLTLKQVLFKLFEVVNSAPVFKLISDVTPPTSFTSFFISFTHFVVALDPTMYSKILFAQSEFQPSFSNCVYDLPGVLSEVFGFSFPSISPNCSFLCSWNFLRDFLISFFSTSCISLFLFSTIRPVQPLCLHY